MFVARPGLGPNAARLGEITLALLRRGGLDGDRAVEALRVLLVYSLGFAAFQAPRLAGDAGARAARAEATYAGLPEDRRSLQVIEDACVPVDRIGEYIGAVFQFRIAGGSLFGLLWTREDGKWKLVSYQPLNP